MEAARIAALRGHDVTLYEKRGTLGFMLDFANMVKGPHENIADLKNYLIRQMTPAALCNTRKHSINAFFMIRRALLRRIFLLSARGGNIFPSFSV